MNLCDSVTVMHQGIEPGDRYAERGPHQPSACSTPTSAVANDEDSPRRSSMAESDAFVRFDGVVAGYGGGDVLKGVDFDVPQGGVTCIVGPNGSGKSTLLKTVSGLVRPRLGQIWFKGDARWWASVRARSCSSASSRCPRTTACFAR